MLKVPLAKISFYLSSVFVWCSVIWFQNVNARVISTIAKLLIGKNPSLYSFLEFYKNHQIGENGVSIFSQPNEQHVEILNIKT